MNGCFFRHLSVRYRSRFDPLLVRAAGGEKRPPARANSYRTASPPWPMADPNTLHEKSVKLCFGTQKNCGKSGKWLIDRGYSFPDQFYQLVEVLFEEVRNGRDGVFPELTASGIELEFGAELVDNFGMALAVSVVLFDDDFSVEGFESLADARPAGLGQAAAHGVAMEEEARFGVEVGVQRLGTVYLKEP